MNDIAKANLAEKKKNPIVTYLRQGFVRFLKIRGQPHEIACGLALGLVIGMTPLMGLQIAIAVSLAALLKWNKISAAGGVFITNPFTAPIIYPINYLVGAKLMGVSNHFILSQDAGFSTLVAMIRKAPEIFWIMTVGGFVLSLPLAAGGYYLALRLLQRYQDEIKRKIAASKEKLAMKKELRKKRKIKKKAGKKSREMKTG
jgi:uncharacterized protein (DUF2062 family)